MPLFRVIQEFKLTGPPPTQAATDRMIGRFRDAAPEAGAVVEPGLGRMQVAMTFAAEDADAAVAQATSVARTVLGGKPQRVDVRLADHDACAGRRD